MGETLTPSRWSGSTRLLTCSCGLSSTPQRFWRYLWVDLVTIVVVFFSFAILIFLPILITSISFQGYLEKVRIPVKKITAIAVREEVKKIQNKERLSEHDETSIKFLKEAINCIPLANQDGFDFENAAFILTLQAGSLLLQQERVIENITFRGWQQQYNL